MAPGGDYAVLTGEGLLDHLGSLVSGLGRWTKVAVVSDDPEVGCILDGQAYYGDLPFGAARANPASDPFRFVVAEVGRKKGRLRWGGAVCTGPA